MAGGMRKISFVLAILGFLTAFIERAKGDPSEIITPLQHMAAVSNAVFNADESKILTSSNDGTVRLFSARNGKTLVPHMRHTCGVIDLCRIYTAVFNVDESKILTSSSDGTARIWSASTGEELTPLPMHHPELGVVKAASFNADESMILTIFSGDEPKYHYTVHLWSAREGKQLIPAMHHGGEVKTAVLSADESKILTAAADGTARLWNSSTGKELVPAMRHQTGTTLFKWITRSFRIDAVDSYNPVQSAVFNSDESKILTRSHNGELRLWDAGTGEELMPDMDHARLIDSAEFSTDKSKILTSSRDDRWTFGNAVKAKDLITALRHDGDIRGAIFSADERSVLIWSNDGLVRLWNVSGSL